MILFQKETSLKFTSVQTCRGAAWGEGDGRAYPQGGIAVQANKLAISVLSCCTETKLKPQGFPQTNTGTGPTS